MSVKIEFPAYLKRFAGGKGFIKSPPGNLVDILTNIKKIYPDFAKKIFMCDKKLKSYVVLFLDNVVIEKKEFQNTEAVDGQIIKIVIAIAGG